MAWLMTCALPCTCLGADDAVGSLLALWGTVSAQRGEEPVRILGRSAPLFRDDVLTTGASSAAIVQLVDGTKMSLRPETRIVLEEYSEQPGGERATVGLLRGGLRAVTGLISKRRPGAFRVESAVATVGIRGTEFDARLCPDGCGAADGRAGQQGDAAAVMARVAFLGGNARVHRADGTILPVAVGSALGDGDSLITDANSYAIVAFRDGARTTVQADSHLRIDRFRYLPGAPEAGESRLSLLRGGLRFLSGLIGAVRPEGFDLRAGTATIGIRGTGFDVYYTNPLAVFVWEGAVLLRYSAGALVIQEGDTYFLAKDTAEPMRLERLPTEYQGPGPRPDAPEVDEAVDMERLFGAVPPPAVPNGLYVYVRGGEVTLSRDQEMLLLGSGEIGLANDEGIVRLSAVPAFILDDPFSPAFNGDWGPSSPQTGEIDRLLDDRPDGLICEM